jgi:hypothetical protein
MARPESTKIGTAAKPRSEIITLSQNRSTTSIGSKFNTKSSTITTIRQNGTPTYRYPYWA